MMTSGGGAATDRGIQYFLLEHYYLRHGTQLARIHEFFEKGLLPAANKIHSGPKIFLEAVMASHLPQVSAIFGMKSLDEAANFRAALRQNDAFGSAFAAWESGPEPPYEHFSQILLKAADYSNDGLLQLPKARSPRYFELRTYHSPTWRQLAALHRRFAGPEIQIFHRVGVHPVLYSETAIGPNMPNLTYLIPFDSLAAREKAWDAFAADPEWIKVRKESIEQSGQIAAVIQISLHKAAPYSPIA